MTAEWRLDLPFTAPMSLNDRQHWRQKAAHVKVWRHAAKTLAQKAQIPALDRVQLELHYAPRDARRRDPLNLVASLKAVEDGVVEAGVIPDDTTDYSIPTMPVIDPPTRARTGALYLIVRHVPKEPT